MDLNTFLLLHFFWAGIVFMAVYLAWTVLDAYHKARIKSIEASLESSEHRIEVQKASYEHRIEMQKASYEHQIEMQKASYEHQIEMQKSSSEHRIEMQKSSRYLN